MVVWRTRTTGHGRRRRRWWGSAPWARASPRRCASRAWRSASSTTRRRRPGRFLGTHWFNPPEWTPGVEVIPAGATDEQVVERTVAVLRAIGKRPTVVGDGPGFVANRLQSALFAEAVACVDDGLATPAQVDEVVRTTFGFRLPFFGPFQIADMAGLDVYREVFGTLEHGLGRRFRPPAALGRLVEADRRGTKNGAGFFDYTAGERERLLAERDRRYAALAGLLGEHPPVTAGSEPGAATRPTGTADPGG
ncbi:MAG: 3-hydroxyacyl-CoA dehydrogenase family protein [Actinobacteria bacterium]|nr:3-hydroxyacyl-CoA dehydrogenase family protein [Actinomycetota bacterium]